MNPTRHAAKRAGQRDISAREIILTRNRPQRQWRTRDRIIRTRDGVVLVCSLDDHLITCYRDSSRG